MFLKHGPMTIMIHNKKQRFEDFFLTLQKNLMNRLQPNYQLPTQEDNNNKIACRTCITPCNYTKKHRGKKKKKNHHDNV
jgi:hypothetical protein